MTLILLQSPSAIRHAFYELFLHLHQALAALALGGVYVHLDNEESRAQFAVIKGVLAIWVIDRGLRLARILYRNVGRRGSYA